MNEQEPCAGKNCGSTNPRLHSADCFAEHREACGAQAILDLNQEAASVLVEWRLMWENNRASKPMIDENTLLWNIAGKLMKQRGIKSRYQL